MCCELCELTVDKKKQLSLKKKKKTKRIGSEMLIFFFSYCPTFQPRYDVASSFPFQEHCHDSQTPISYGLYFV